MVHTCSGDGAARNFDRVLISTLEFTLKFKCLFCLFILVSRFTAIAMVNDNV